jgi:hypothetical protein
VVPRGTEAKSGVILMPTRVAPETRTAVCPATRPKRALMMALPGPTVMAWPCEPGAVETTSTARSLDSQLTVVVTSPVVPSE